MSITTRQIEAFRATMLTGSTKAAAEMLCVTQPVVSRLLSQLESSIGYPLFLRKGNSLIPNEKALILLESAKKIFHEVQAFHEVSRNIATHNLNTIKLFCSPTLATSVLPRIIQSQQEIFFSTQFEIYSRLIEKIPGEIISNKNAIGISIWPTQDKTVHCELLGQRTLSVAVHPKNPLAHKTLITLDDLIGEKIITYHQNLPLGRMIAEQLSPLAHCLQLAYLIENSEIAYALTRENLGVAIIDSFSRSYLESQGLAVIAFETSIKTNLCLITSKLYDYGRELQAIRQAILAWLDQEAYPVP